ncbi:MAG: hypothetical protein AAFY50_04865 [Cyanobacteria bacterium J06648_1]
MFDNKEADLIPTTKHNSSSISQSSNGDIQDITQAFIRLQHENSHPVASGKRGLNKLFRTEEEKIKDEINVKKIRTFHEHEMQIAATICNAKKQDIQMQIAAALSQRKVVLDTQSKAYISEVYQNFGRQMNAHINEAVNMYLEGIRQSESASDALVKKRLREYAENKFKQDFDLVEDLAKDALRNIYAGLNKSS